MAKLLRWGQALCVLYVILSGSLAWADSFFTPNFWSGSSGNINRSSGNVGVGSVNPGQKLDVNGTIRSSNLTASKILVTDANKNIISGPVSSAIQESSFGYSQNFASALTIANVGAFAKIINTATLDNLEINIINFTCTGNPSFALYDCGSDITCGTSPSALGTSGTISTVGSTDVTVSSSALTAAHYIGFGFASGTCTALKINVNGMYHTN